MLQNSANNKNVEKYNRLISENLTTTTGFQNKKGHKTNSKRKNPPIISYKRAQSLKHPRYGKNKAAFIKMYTTLRSESCRHVISIYYHSSTHVLPVVP